MVEGVPQLRHVGVSVGRVCGSARVADAPCSVTARACGVDGSGEGSIWSLILPSRRRRCVSRAVSRSVCVSPSPCVSRVSRCRLCRAEAELTLLLVAGRGAAAAAAAGGDAAARGGGPRPAGRGARPAAGGGAGQARRRGKGPGPVRAARVPPT